jgi:hypothetical protein
VTTTQNVFSERSFLVVANSFLEHIKDEHQQSITRDIKKQAFSMPPGGTTSSPKLSYVPDYVLYCKYRGAQCPDNSASENVARVVPVLTVIAEGTSWETSNDNPLKGSCKGDSQVCE